MQPLSRKLVKIGIILVAFGVTMALLLGLSVGLIFAATWVFDDSVDNPLTGIPGMLTVESATRRWSPSMPALLHWLEASALVCLV